MPSPTYDGSKIFDSTRTGTANTFSEGVCRVFDYAPILQKLHFNGEFGDRYLSMGYPDREWTYEGLLSSTSLADLMSKVATIESKIDVIANDPTQYKVLVDSYGNSWSKAQIQGFAYVDPPHIETDYASYTCRIKVRGIVQGGTQESGGSSSSGG